MTMIPCARLFAGVFTMASLSGCHEPETPAQLRAWINAEHAQASAPPFLAPPLPSFVAQAYQADSDNTPFGRLRPSASATIITRPQQRGAPQVLEEFSLENMRMVGTLSQGGRRHVLLQVDSIVYQAKAGDYLGKNFGMILRIADHQTELEELIPDADERWTRRIATLPLQGESQ